MTPSDTIGAIRNNRVSILWWEFCCLLHDIGKLSDDFLAYRQLWHAMKGGYSEKDPHDHKWFEKDSILKEFPALEKFFTNPIAVLKGIDGELSVKNAVHNHIGGLTAANELCQLLQAADGLDSRYDRNNPLLGCEQTTYNHAPGARLSEIIPKLPEMYRGNVFGYERPVRRGALDLAKADEAEADESDGARLQFVPGGEGDLDPMRRKFYSRLEDLLNLKSPHPDLSWPIPDKGYRNFRAIRDTMREHWDDAMSDTTRPNNDTSLWEHVYSVSAILRAFLVKRLVHGRSLGRKDQRFSVWGFGFDSLSYISSAHKIGDVIARQQVIAEVFDRAQRYIEYTLPCGNEIYRDENCIFFLIADALLEAHLEAKAAEWLRSSKGELLPVFAKKSSITNLTCLPELIEEIREKSADPRATQLMAGRLDAFHDSWNKGSASICPVCRLRPAAQDEKICKACRDRRSRAGKDRNPKQTAFLAEIADESGRGALIVARLGLRDWLNGKLVHTMLVTEPHGARTTLESLDKFRDLVFDAPLREWRDGRLKLPDTFDTMKNEFAEVEGKQSGKAPYANLIYGRGLKQIESTKAPLVVRETEPGLFKVLDETKEELKDRPGANPDTDLLNAFCAKTPTPSTLLDVWETTLEFMESIAGSVDRERPGGSGWLAGLLPSRPRLWIEVGKEPNEIHENETVEVDLGGVPCELVYLGKAEGKPPRFGILGRQAVSLEGWVNPEFTIPQEDNRAAQTLTITAAGVEPHAYHPFRVITASPALLLLLVPAASAVEITQEVYRRYLAEFGKAWGRLPLAVGNIFFPQHTPMFSVLDAARRMERGFRHLQDGAWAETEVHARALAAPLHLGGGQADFHHPYLRLCPNDKGDRDFETMAGPLIHTSRAAGRTVMIRPNIYKPAWLGSSSARFEVECLASLARPLAEDLRTGAGSPLADWLARTKSERGDGLPAMLLDDFDQKVAGFWERMRAAGVSDSTLRNVSSVLASHSQAWQHQKPDGPTAARRIALAAGHRFPETLQPMLASALNDRSFDQVIKLYVHILKQRLEEKEQSSAVRI